jgi:nicotinamidase-related amidase
MPAKTPDLHGNAPDNASTALVLIDVINDMQFPGGDRLLAQARPMATRRGELKRRAKAAGIPAIYANDNFGRLAVRLLGAGAPLHRGRRARRADRADAAARARRFLRARAQALGVLLDRARHAADAFLRDLNVIVPVDRVASVEPRAA